MATGENFPNFRKQLLTVGIFDDDVDGIGVRVKQDHIGTGVGAGAAHRVIILATPIGYRGNGVPIILKIRVALAGTQMDLNRG